MRRWMKLTAALVLSVVVLTGAALAAEYTPKNTEKADVLNALGLFAGTDSGYALDRECDRLQGAALLVRLLGGEKEAKEQNYAHPFADVQGSWASPYVGYLYQKGLSKGSSATTYGTGDMGYNDFATFCLRALGYNDANGDFAWNWALSAMKGAGLLGQTEYDEIVGHTVFSRDDAVLLCYRAVTGNLNGASPSQTLGGKLCADGAVTAVQVADSGDALVQLYSGVMTLENIKLPLVVGGTSAEDYPADRYVSVNSYTEMQFNAIAAACNGYPVLRVKFPYEGEVPGWLHKFYNYPVDMLSFNGFNTGTYVSAQEPEGYRGVTTETQFLVTVDGEDADKSFARLEKFPKLIEALRAEQEKYGQTGPLIYYTYKAEDVATYLKLSEAYPTVSALLYEDKMIQVGVAFRTVADKIAAENQSDYDKIKAVNDYLVDTLTYDKGRAKYDKILKGYDSEEEARADHPDIPAYNSHRLDGVFLDQKAVCSGYAWAFELFMKDYGIPCYYVRADAKKEGEASHAWNLVQLDGAWYNVDATWNDTQGPKTKYLLISGEKLMRDHNIYIIEVPEEMAAYPAAPKDYQP